VGRRLPVAAEEIMEHVPPARGAQVWRG
jgi:hypothetical protein